MDIISMSNKYRYRNGEPAKVLLVDRPGFFPVLSIREDGTLHAHIQDGRLGVNFTTDYDLIEVSLYEDFKIDDKVMVRDSEETAWLRRYFAGVNPNSGYPMTGSEGTTMWSRPGYTTSWKFCRKPTEEELKP